MYQTELSTELYEAKISFLICLTEHLVIKSNLHPDSATEQKKNIPLTALYVLMLLISVF